MSKKEQIICYRGYKSMTVDDAEKLRNVKRSPSSEDVVINSTPDVIQELFAPDPQTGNPSSDFFIRASADSDVKDYIDKYLMQKVQSSPVTSDPQFALDSAKSRFESVEEYASRLRELISKDSK